MPPKKTLQRPSIPSFPDCTRTWFASLPVPVWYKTLDKTAPNKQYTHTMLGGGGIFVLESREQYEKLYRNLATDIVDGNNVSVCERFPPIRGSWNPQIELLPPPSLVNRAYRVLRRDRSTLPKYALDELIIEKEKEMENELKEKNSLKEKGQDWTSCNFAMDLDYGEFEKAYDLKEILDDVRHIRTIILKNVKQDERSEVNPSKLANCYVCVTDDNNKLGVHLYFPFIRIFPEEAMMLAEICRAVMTNERASSQFFSKGSLRRKPTKEELTMIKQDPLRKNVKHSWYDIIDASIYTFGETLRMPFVRKVAFCKICHTIENRTFCQACKNTGLLLLDRRYWPVCLLAGEKGEIKEKELWARLKYNLEKHLRNKNSTSPEARKELIQQIEFFLTMTSLRLSFDKYSQCMIKDYEEKPMPQYSRTFLDFWESIFWASQAAREDAKNVIWTKDGYIKSKKKKIKKKKKKKKKKKSWIYQKRMKSTKYWFVWRCYRGPILVAST